MEALLLNIRTLIFLDPKGQRDYSAELHWLRTLPNLRKSKPKVGTRGAFQGQSGSSRSAVAGAPTKVESKVQDDCSLLARRGRPARVSR